jgi:hypothetical protein
MKRFNIFVAIACLSFSASAFAHIKTCTTTNPDALHSQFYMSQEMENAILIIDGTSYLFNQRGVNLTLNPQSKDPGFSVADLTQNGGLEVLQSNTGQDEIIQYSCE